MQNFHVVRIAEKCLHAPNLKNVGRGVEEEGASGASSIMGWPGFQADPRRKNFVGGRRSSRELWRYLPFRFTSVSSP